MRDKAVLVFDEIARIQGLSHKAPMTTIKEFTIDQKPEPLSVDTSPDSLATLRALLAVYFPSTLSIMASYDKSLAEAMKPITSKMATVVEKPMSEQSSTLTAVRFEIAMLLWQNQIKLCRSIHSAMIEAVKPYTPTA